MYYIIYISMLAKHPDLNSEMIPNLKLFECQPDATHKWESLHLASRDKTAVKVPQYKNNFLNYFSAM